MNLKNYVSKLNLKDTEKAIKLIKDTFEKSLSNNLNLIRVSAPLFIKPETGLNDNLNGTERPVSFDIKSLGNKNYEIVHSLAKWKRYALKRYEFNVGEGLYTDMNAIRRDEDIDNLHSVYVDQWDWEIIISKNNRTIEVLKEFVEKIYSTFLEVENILIHKYNILTKKLPNKINFITSQELYDLYPNLSSKDREKIYAKQYGAIFIMKIGDQLSCGEAHDGRASDYDDWSLNGDIVFYYDVLDIAFEVSSMGIRVNKESLIYQLECKNEIYKSEMSYHSSIINNELPQTIGGGIGQSRICMFFLEKAHIGEVQASIWDEKNIEECRKNNITLL